MTELQPVRGTRDLIGEDQRRHQHVIETARRIAATLWLRRMGDPDLRGYPRLLPQPRRDLRRRDEGDVHLRGPRRRQRHPAPGEHRRRLPRPGQQRPDPVAAAEGVLCRADVPLRAAAEGPLPPVPPDRHRGDRPRRAAGRCRGDRLRLGHPAGARRRRGHGAGDQHPGRRGKPRTPTATRWSAISPRTGRRCREDSLARLERTRCASSTARTRATARIVAGAPTIAAT